MASRAIDALISYRIIKLLVTPFDRQEAFKYGIIDKDGKVLRKYKTLQKPEEKRAYTVLHRFVFNLKRILQRVGLGGRLGTFAVALGLLLKENKEYLPHKQLIERSVIKYLKDNNLYEEMLNEQMHVQERIDTPEITCFGIDLYMQNGELVSEENYAKTL